jgi:NAD(P)-dependent dehydrogenase (short-subunit alcohol dehydrogenase family)
VTTHTRFSTPFTRESSTDEVLAGVDLTGRRAIVTGSSGGIGVETARALAAAGAEVIMAVRNVRAGEHMATEIAAKTGNAKVRAVPLDLADQASVAAFTGAWRGPLHILVNNAGIMALPELHRTPEGWELQFATNYLGHFALAQGLHDALTAAGDARIVAVSSSAHRRSPIVFDDINFVHRAYEPWAAYGQSKTAVVLFAVEASKRWAADGVIANAAMPGGIRTNLQRHQEANLTPEIKEVFDNYPWRSVEQGAATSVLLAASPLLNGIGGRYFEDSNEAGPNVPPAELGVAAHAIDPVAAARLWDVSLDMLAS